MAKSRAQRRDDRQFFMGMSILSAVFVVPTVFFIGSLIYWAVTAIISAV